MSYAKPLWVATALGIVGAAVGLYATGDADAADHLDPARVSAMPGNPADIGDLYAWHDAAGNVVVVLTFAGPTMPDADQAAAYDRDVLYTIHIDSTGDGIAETDIEVRFGQNTGNEWGVLAMNVPGADGPIVGAADTTLSSGTSRIATGLFDDPFFFDLQGFRTTEMTGTLAMLPDQDFFAGQNISAIVLEFPVSALSGTDHSIWATTARAR